jgi:hypothetical protein
METEGKKNLSSNIPWYVKVGFFLVLAFLAWKGWQGKNLIFEKFNLGFLEGKIDEKCIRKKVNGTYLLSLFFDKSNKIEYKNSLEITYYLEITKEDCNVDGIGNKDSDSNSQLKKGKKNYSPEDYPVSVNGKIATDTLYFELTQKTFSSNDSPVKINLNFNRDSITCGKYIEGSFSEKLNNSRGRAKLVRLY